MLTFIIFRKVAVKGLHSTCMKFILGGSWVCWATMETFSCLSWLSCNKDRYDGGHSALWTALKFLDGLLIFFFLWFHWRLLHNCAVCVSGLNKWQQLLWFQHKTMHVQKPHTNMDIGHTGMSFQYIQLWNWDSNYYSFLNWRLNFLYSSSSQVNVVGVHFGGKELIEHWFLRSIYLVIINFLEFGNHGEGQICCLAIKFNGLFAKEAA